jgi:6-phosphofructokinase 1
MHDGGLAPGMNAAVRAAVRLGHDRGHVMLGVQDGFAGLSSGGVRELSLADVEGWSGLGGADLGTRRFDVADEHLYAVARTIEDHRIDALILIGGFAGYELRRRGWELIVREMGYER